MGLRERGGGRGRKGKGGEWGGIKGDGRTFEVLAVNRVNGEVG